MFKTAYCEEVHKRIYCNSGNAVKDEFMLRMVNDSDDLVLTGHTSLYDYIQSHADSLHPAPYYKPLLDSQAFQQYP